jgi:uncharacterized protein (TIGR02246 family)
MSARSPEQLHALIAEAVNASDLDAFAALHETDATIVLPPEGRRVSGHDAIRAAMTPLLAMRPELTVEVVAKLEADGLALTYGRWNMTISPGGERSELSGRGTMVSRRQPDGSWRIVLDDPIGPV